jgi:hypothetical protein
MVQRIGELNMKEMLEEFRAMPRFDEAFRQLELSQQANLLVGLLEDGTFHEYTFIPRAVSMAKVQIKKITREETIEQYKPSDC